MARARKSSARNKGSVKVNFKDVESRRTPPEGDYPLTVLEAKLGTSSAQNEQIEFVFEISRGEYRGQKVWFYCPLAENSLWKLHALLTAMGEDVPQDEMDIDLSDLIGREIVGVLTHETYQGKKKAKMTDFDSIDNYSGEDEEEDEKPTGKKSKKEDEKPSKSKGKKAVDEDDDEDEDEKPKAKGKKKVVDEDDEDEDDDDDEKPSKSKGKKKPKKIDRSDVEEMDEDELQELLEEHGLEDEVDLDDYKKLSKKVAAVIEALEEADLLEDDDD